MTELSSSPAHIAIIGSGFSGTLVAVHLLRLCRRPLQITLLERDEQRSGRGVAYSTGLDCQLLNVPASNMSAIPDDPQHFLRWAEAHQSQLINPPWVNAVGPGAFLPRRAYGDYLRTVLEETLKEAAPGVVLNRRIELVSGASETPDGVLLRLQNGETLSADRVVLALGNFPPGNHVIANPGFYDSPRYYSDPWSPGVLAKILDTRSCLLIGSGLTMVDWAMALKQANYQGQIHAISRRGLWPQAHQAVSPTEFKIDPDTRSNAISTWLKNIRTHIKETGADWRAVIDALRPFNQALWKSLPAKEKQRFLRHLRPFWDCHRHRLAPVIAGKLQNLLDSNKLVRHVGRVLDLQETADGVEALILPRHQKETRTLEIEAVINCSGSASNYRKLENPLVRDLLRQNLIRPDALSLGLDTGADGALIGHDGSNSRTLYTLGPPAKGTLWETTAVPEIRHQALELAQTLLS